tara:strand:- start:4144 stop:4749 length:606 start_codon:yes stop_codon:yes gene_type:complete
MSSYITLGFHNIKINDAQKRFIDDFKDSDYYRKCMLTGAREFFLHCPKYALDGAFITLVDIKVVFGYELDKYNLYLLDDIESHYVNVNNMDQFIELFNPVYFKSLFFKDNREDLSFKEFIDILKHTPKLYKFYEYYEANADHVKDWYLQVSLESILDEEYSPDYYSHSQEYEVNTSGFENNSDIVGEIKTKTFNGSIKPHT